MAALFNILYTKLMFLRPLLLQELERTPSHAIDQTQPIPISMSPAHQPRRFWRLTYPRTGSNLLERILALEDQPSIVTGPRQRTGYFFMPSIVLRLVKLKTAGRHIDTLTVGERTQLMESYQACFEDLQQHVNTAEAHGKDVYVKEHAPWLMEPVAETKFKFGRDSTRETPWTVNAFEQQTHSPRNETVLPDEFLKTWLPTYSDPSSSAGISFRLPQNHGQARPRRWSDFDAVAGS